MSNKVFIMNKFQACYRLMRIDNPIGFFLLLWPTLWALWLAGKGTLQIKTLTIFILGVIFMRSAGCTINDYADRKFDSHIARTKHRPLSINVISEKETKFLFGILSSVSFYLMLMLNTMTIYLSIVAFLLTCVYPFMKRYIHFPQLVLGIAFSWTIPMAFSEVSGSLPIDCWLLFVSNLTWTVAYDTEYSMIDRDDDMKIGIKSTAILFGHFDKLIIGCLQLTTLLFLEIIGWRMMLGSSFHLSILLSVALFLWQQKLLIEREKKKYFSAFLNNNYVGMLIFIGIFFEFFPPCLITNFIH